MLNADRALYKIYIAVDCVYHFAGRVALHIFGVLVMARQLYLVNPLQFRRSLTRIIQERSGGLRFAREKTA
jgi:hypothetical protein